mmetsp:Transcript_36093/g.36774  ORF Transcript_36093/g.36774 Transcript_36093/m.36774 type:complete len:557 (+) Transcript_36093:123-1793(+)
MAAIFEHGTLPNILCCMCGIEIHYNPANMCVTCLRSQVDITQEIKTELTIHSCRSCKRFLCPPWRELEQESKELMSVCLKKIPGLSKLKLIDAVWIWTEPHSMRLKIKLTIQKEVTNGAILQQAAIINYTIRNQQCEDCQSAYATGVWQAIVAVRQRVAHKRTFFYLEQLLLKHHAHSDCIKIVTFRDGMDFYFSEKGHAIRFIDFLTAHVPTRDKYARKLVSQDKCDNSANYKHNFLIDIVPLCKDDLVVLPIEMAKSLSDICPLVLVSSVSADVHIIDPITCELQDIKAEKYFRKEFPSLMTCKDLIPFIILSVEPVLHEQRASAKKRRNNRKLKLAECVVVRERDFGVTDTQFTCVTHLGGLLKEGHVVLGYDLTCAAWVSDQEITKSLKREIPDVILVRKLCVSKRDRMWTLRNLEVDEHIINSKETETAEGDMEIFMQELEADKEYRKSINLYKNKRKNKYDNDIIKNPNKEEIDEEKEEDDDDENEVQLDELLDDLTLSDAVLDEESTRVLTHEEIEIQRNRTNLNLSDLNQEENTFDSSNIDVNKFKFT